MLGVERIEELENIENQGSKSYELNHPDHGRKFVDYFLSLSDTRFKARFRLHKSSFLFLASKVILIVLESVKKYSRLKLMKTRGVPLF